MTNPPASIPGTRQARVSDCPRLAWQLVSGLRRSGRYMATWLGRMAVQLLSVALVIGFPLTYLLSVVRVLCPWCRQYMTVNSSLRPTSARFPGCATSGVDCAAAGSDETRRPSLVSDPLARIVLASSIRTSAIRVRAKRPIENPRRSDDRWGFSHPPGQVAACGDDRQTRPRAPTTAHRTGRLEGVSFGSPALRSQ